jgi:UDP-N-acetyl-D-mannosaminuronate dehydrogenase
MKSCFKEANKQIENSEILILGVSYKANVKDIQISPAEPIIQNLKDLKVKVKIFDPYYKDVEIFGIKTESNLVNALKNIDGLVLVTNHKEFDDLDPSMLHTHMRTPIVVDSRGVIDYDSAKKAGLIFKSLGQGE